MEKHVYLLKKNVRKKENFRKKEWKKRAAHFDKKEWHSSFPPNLGGGTRERRSKECRSCTHWKTDIFIRFFLNFEPMCRNSLILMFNAFSEIISIKLLKLYVTNLARQITWFFIIFRGIGQNTLGILILWIPIIRGRILPVFMKWNFTDFESFLVFFIMVIQIVEFSSWGYKFGKFLPKNQHTQRKFSNFENWTNGEPQ